MRSEFVYYSTVYLLHKVGTACKLSLEIPSVVLYGYEEISKSKSMLPCNYAIALV